MPAQPVEGLRPVETTGDIPGLGPMPIVLDLPESLADLIDENRVLKAEKQAIQKRETDGFTENWPLGMQANIPQRRICRGEQQADLASHKTLWDALRIIVHNHPSATMPKALEHDEVEIGAVYVTIAHLRKLLAPLGVAIPNAGKRGYVLEARQP
jgi:hypothetical protein